MRRYDNRGQHSTFEHFAQATRQGLAALPPGQVAVGLPFYGRSVRTGDWTSYEDLAGSGELSKEQDTVGDVFFNGVATIRRKVRHALDAGAGGVMVWEVGQDCRLAPTVHGDTTHVATCPHGDDSSLIVAITREVAEGGPAEEDEACPS